MIFPHSDKQDYRLRLIVWGLNSTIDPRTEYFPHDAWDAATFRAWELSKNDSEPISRIQVVDAWGMLISQFTHRSIIMGPERFKEWMKTHG